MGGAEVVAHRQARALKERGFKVTILAGGLPNEGLLPGFLNLETVDGLDVYRLTLRSLSPDGNFFWREAGLRFRAIHKLIQPDVVHFHNVMGLGANLIPLAKSLGSRTIVTLHDHWGFCFKNTRLRNDGALCDNAEECASCLTGIAASDATLPIRLRRDYVAWCLDQADQKLSPSIYLADSYQRFSQGRTSMSVLSNGIDLEDIDAAPKPIGDPVRFVTFAYLGEHKGIPVLMKAAERLAQDSDLRGRWTLTIAGHGHLEGDIRGAIEQGRFGDAVSFVGRIPRDHAIDLMKQSHVVVLPSNWPENEPVTMLEAIATGTAQLASGIGGNLELVEHNGSGLLFKPGDDEDLASAMRRFIVEPGLAETFGRRNAERRDRFTERNTADKLAELYKTPPDQAQTGAEEVLILCVGDAPAEDIRLMAHHLHRIENIAGTVRLIWHEWADASMWSKAALVWVWSADGPAEVIPMIAKAFRYGLPVLAPARSSALGCAGPQGLPYASLLDAMAWIAAFEDGARDLVPPEVSAALARKLNAVAPQSSFRFAANLT